MGRMLEELKKIKDYGMQAYWEKDYEGSCPCFNGKKVENGKFVEVWGRCWRVSENIDSGFQDLHISGDHPELKEIAKEVKRALDAQSWHNPYNVMIDELNHIKGE